MSDFGGLIIDRGCVAAMIHYFQYGLHPGSFAEACLLGDYDLAYSKAHVVLKEQSEGQDVVANMVKVAQAFPDCAVGSREIIQTWMGHQGLFDAPKEKVILVRLQWTDELLGPFEFVMQRLKNDQGKH